eukprot:7834749-Pyramimonas_sp.AAC.1
MHMFGARTQKPTWLYSSKAFIQTISHYAIPIKERVSPDDAPEMCRYYQDSWGQTKFTRGAHMKESQSYPRGFGEAMARMLQDNANSIMDSATFSDEQSLNQSPPAEADMDPWADANLGGPMQLLTANMAQTGATALQA